MNSSYDILTNQQLVIETLSKSISPNEYSKLKVNEFQDKNFNRTYNLITDLSNFNDNFSKEKLEDLFIIFKENKGKFIRNKSAIVASNSAMLKTINTIINKDKKIFKQIKTFKKLDAAKKWMQ